jgi:diguanylate cyclase (GGDEF)-like protein
MRAGVAATTLDGIDERTTISIGVATRQNLETVAEAWEELLKEADANLYRAKSEGRDRVI